jgi:flavodoxin
LEYSPAEEDFMHSLVIYASRSGNTQRIAEAIADGLRTRGPVELQPAAEAPSAIPPEIDLVVIGGPTEAHGMTAPMKEFLDRLAPDALKGRRAAGFDTRLRWPLLLSGSAGAGITGRLHAQHANVVAPEESFFVTRKPELEPGEVERAAAWAAGLAA